MHFFAALGNISDELVKRVNEYNAGVIRRDANREPTINVNVKPVLSKRSEVARENAVLPKRRGVQHKMTKARRARKQARSFGNQVERELRGRKMTKARRHDLERRLDKLWEEADQLSYESKEPFTDQWGDRQNQQFEKGLVETVLAELTDRWASQGWRS